MIDMNRLEAWAWQKQWFAPPADSTLISLRRKGHYSAHLGTSDTPLSLWSWLYRHIHPGPEISWVWWLCQLLQRWLYEPGSFCLGVKAWLGAQHTAWGGCNWLWSKSSDNRVAWMCLGSHFGTAVAILEQSKEKLVGVRWQVCWGQWWSRWPIYTI